MSVSSVIDIVFKGRAEDAEIDRLERSIEQLGSRVSATTDKLGIMKDAISDTGDDIAELERKEESQRKEIEQLNNEILNLSKGTMEQRREAMRLARSRGEARTSV